MKGGKTRAAGVRRWTAGAAELLVPAVCLGIFAVVGVLPLTASQQWVFGGSLIVIAWAVDKGSRSYLATLLMMLLSCFATFRYAVWRYSTLFEFFRYATPERHLLDLFFMSVLALAELYTMLILYLGYFQMAYPLKRKPVAMPDALEIWPHVDVLIPTYHEPLELVRYTVLAAMNMDWPSEKLHIFLLDDGRRPDFHAFAERVGVQYVTRTGNEGAKAGNINSALRNTRSPYVAIFDCDHVPVRSFLQFTMGWFFRDPKMALVQTPHHFYSPDPFERNLKQYREVPNEGKLFYGMVQVCNDFWNATFFCGSCAVIRREALDEVGGIATETVTEDAHTSLRMQMAGWNTAYLNTPQAAGLATERLSGHVRQRIRWARGMVQVLRREKPLLARGLSWPQRLCYFNAMVHFLYALPRLIFLTAPLVYLLFGDLVIPGSWGLILAFATPHLLLAQVTNSRVQGEHRHSFWNEVYESVLAPYILLPTLLALVRPKSGKFDVTDKGGVVENSYLDLHMAQPFFLLLFFLVIGLAMAPVRYFYLDPMHHGAVLINALWDLISIVIIGVVIGVAHESQQRRQSTRIAMRTLATIVLPNGDAYEGSTVDLSSGGSAIHLDDYLPPSGGVEVQLVLPQPSGSKVSLPARIVGGGGRVIRVQFQELSVAQERKLVGVLFSRANAWVNWSGNTPRDSMLRSGALILRLSCNGIGQAVGTLFHPTRSKPTPPNERERVTAPVSMLVALLVLGGMAVYSPRLSAQRLASSSSHSLVTESRPVSGPTAAVAQAPPQGQRQASPAKIAAAAVSRASVHLTGVFGGSPGLGNSLYRRGKISLWRLFSVELGAYPYLGALVMLLVCFLLAVVTNFRLRRRAVRRLGAGLWIALLFLAARGLMAETGPSPAPASPGNAEQISAAWPLWNAYAARFIDSRSRVIDPDRGDITTSEGQAYAMFFSLVANDRPHFERLLEWTSNNLAHGDMTVHLPAWEWGRAADGSWHILDANSAADADLWMSYTLIEAGRLWKIPRYRSLGIALAALIAEEEVEDLPGMGRTLLPASSGFRTADGAILNPSYSPLPVLEGMATAMPDGPWGAMAAGLPELLRRSSVKGFAMDWVGYSFATGFRPATLPGVTIDAVPTGSYDAIRVYLWAGLAPPSMPGAGAVLLAMPGMNAYLASHPLPPHVVSASGAVAAADGGVGFSAALLPYLAAWGSQTQQAQQENRLTALLDPKTGLYGSPPHYYDQNLALFAEGWLQKRYRFRANGTLQVPWSTAQNDADAVRSPAAEVKSPISTVIGAGGK